jgi:hypothetical protein
VERLFGVLLSIHHGTPKHGEWVTACLQGAWPKIIGEKLASVCRPAAFADAELVVEVVEPGWEATLESVQPVLLEKLRAASSGLVKTVSLKQGSTGKPA